MVDSTFPYCRDVVLFGMILSWGLEVQAFDLTPEQSPASFTRAKKLATAMGVRHGLTHMGKHFNQNQTEPVEAQ